MTDGDCTTCEGTGLVSDAICQRCGGTGRLIAPPAASSGATGPATSAPTVGPGQPKPARKKRKPLMAAPANPATAGPMMFPGDNVREFLEEVNARWDDIDGALTWFYDVKDQAAAMLAMLAENKESIAAIVKAAGKIAAFLDSIIAAKSAEVPPP
jgi:hypothetical protein